MSFTLLTPKLVDAVHDDVLFAGELPGRARDKSLEGALARVDHRLAYGMIEDALDLAAACAVATGHCFNYANRRTAFRATFAVLALNGIRIDWRTEEIGPVMVEVAQGRVEGADLAAWLRGRAAT